MVATKNRNLPGDMPQNDYLKRVIRVNHAGEYGAKRIYEGQLAVTKNKETKDLIQHMAEQEQAHLDYFDKEIINRDIRPTALMPIWHVAGFALGAITAKMGDKAAMACTVAVEEVIDEHYQSQLKNLSEKESALKEKIEQFRQEELEHRDIGLEHDAEQTPAYQALTAAIKLASKTAIWLSKRV